MSSPAPSQTSSAAAAAAAQPTDIAYRFCSECSNTLYPKEDAARSKLMFTCRTCEHTESAESACVFRNVLNNSSGETAGVTQDVGSDPTLPRANKLCPSCDHGEAVFFQSQQRSAETGMVFLALPLCLSSSVFLS